MVVRLPRIDWAAGSVEHEQAWLPVIGPLLPVATPTPLGLGEPMHGYPWRWSVYTWLDGANPTAEDLTESLVRSIADCLNAIHTLDVPGGPVNRRGFSFEARDEVTRKSISEMASMVDTAAVTRVWDAAFTLRRANLRGPGSTATPPRQPAGTRRAVGRPDRLRRCQPR
jgi:aminoglycoside phosphotransferase (APT) family kinase protein